MPIVITSTVDGFRRGGMAHPKGTVEHPDGTFTDEQLRQLHNEPRLAVIEAIGEVDGEEASSDADSQGAMDESGLDGDLTKLKVADLVEIAQAGGIETKGLTKPALIAAIEAKRESGAAE